MKITILVGPFLPVPPIRGGAVERRLVAIAEKFAAAGHAVTMISRQDPKLPADEVTAGVTYKRIWSHDRLKMRPANFIIDALYTLRAILALPPSDITLTHTFFAPFLLPLQRAGAIYVQVARLPKGQMRYYTRAARLQGVSQQVADLIRAEAPDLADRAIAIPNPLPDAFFGPTPTAPSARERTVLYVGRIAREKGIDLLLRAFARAVERVRQIEGADAPPWTLKVVGPSATADGGDGPQLTSELEKIVQETGISCDFVGPVYDLPSLIKFYRETRIFVYPSLAEKGESFGMSPLEAMVSGAAVIVSSLSCFNEFVRPDENALVFDHRGEGNVEALADALQRLMTDPALCDQLSANALATAEHFRCEAIAARYLADFDSIIAAKREGQSPA